MRLRRVNGVLPFGNWMDDLGYTVGQGPGIYGPVDPDAHVATSLHYKDPSQAYDVNFGSSGPDENEALRELYRRVLRFKRRHPRFPLDEMFFNGFGYMKEYGVDVNHPIEGHDTHLHVGFSVYQW